MSLTTRVGLLAGAAALMLTSVSNARPAGETGNDDLQKRLAAAEAKIASMEAANNQSWLTEQRATEIRGLVQDVLADADTRASLLQTGMTAGYDHGAVLGSSDGNYLLRTNILLQERFIYNNIDNGNSAENGTSNEYGFETARAELILSGHVIDPSWYYNLRLNFGVEDDGDMIFAYIGKDFGNGLSAQMGAMQSQVIREDIVTPENQLAIERSTAAYFFSPGYINGAQVAWTGDKFRVFGQVSDGAFSSFNSWTTADVDFALSARGEFKFSGNWDQFNDFTSPRGSEGGIMIGGAIYWQTGQEGSVNDGVDALILTGDVSWEGNGFNLFASVMYEDFSGDTIIENSPLGFVAQGGWYMNDTWELYGRVEWTNVDVSGVDDLGIFTFGVNKYFSGNNNKMTLDLGYAWNAVPFSDSATGVREDVSTSDGQVIIRYQWQLLF